MTITNPHDPVTGHGYERPHTLRVRGIAEQQLEVHGFAGDEELNGLFRFSVRLSLPSETVMAQELLGREAALTMRSGAHTRTVCGLIAAVETLESTGVTRREQLRVRLVPRLWLLRHKHRSRVFQNLRIDQVVSSVLAEEGIQVQWALSRELPVREYCTQYQESDYGFVRRLLREAALMFRFSRRADTTDPFAGARDPIVFGDDVGLYVEDGEAELHFVGDTAIASPTTAVCTAFATAARVRSNAATYWEYDPARAGVPLTTTATDVPTALDGHGLPTRLEHYDHHAHFHFTKWNDAEQEAPRILRQTRRRAQTSRGSGRHVVLSPGHLLTVHDHPATAPEQRHVVTHVLHEGRDGAGASSTQVYRNEFRCVPAEVVYCPPRPVRRNVSGTLTAVVVGPIASEIHTDSAGRVKVQFHWDREGARDEKSSCWLRTMQSWGGEGWGGQFIPRVGMEVVVTFEGGDPDKPFVLGSLYNGTHPLPFKLPEEAARSGIRTRSTPDSEGFNELSFDDRAGSEQVFLRAQADLVEKVGRDRNETTDRNHSETVNGDQTSRVLGTRIEETIGRHVQKTLADAELHVGGQRLERFGEGRRVVVQGDETSRVAGRSTQSIERSHNLRVGQTFAVEVGAVDKPGTTDLFSWGNTMLGSNMELVLRAESGISLRCGESRLEIHKEGITLRAPKVRIAATEELTATGDGPLLRLDKKAELTAESVRLYGSHSSLELDENAHVDGQLVKLACGERPGEATDDVEKRPSQRLKLVLKDARMAAYAGKAFIVKAGGERVEGTTAADGSFDVAIPIEATTAEVTMWLGKRAASECRRYVIEIEPIDGITTLKGVQQRLRHLGYFHREATGLLDERGMIDSATRAALVELQRDHGLAPSGELSDSTRSKLLELHGN